MSREIKFRAWDNVNNKMIYSPMAICSGDGGWVLFTAEVENMSCYNAIHPIQQYEIMQFTGLTDKHGKDIYEGDIVKWEYEDAVGWHKIKRLVTWVAEDAYFDVPVKRPWIRNVEIIGNIYEQPELLQKAGEA